MYVTLILNLVEKSYSVLVSHCVSYRGSFLLQCLCGHTSVLRETLIPEQSVLYRLNACALKHKAICVVQVECMCNTTYVCVRCWLQYVATENLI